MFKSLFKGRDYLLNKVLEDIEKMLVEVEDMFSFALRVLFNHQDETVDIYKRDQMINRWQIDIRRRLIEHLVLSPEKDVVASLVFTTLVTDIERIGDYVKNVIELAHLYPEEIKEDERIKQLKGEGREILILFSRTKEALKKDDEVKAKEVMGAHVRVAKRCDKFIEELVLEENMSSRRAIFCALVSRYFKRVSAHLKNAASSVVNPFPRIGYKPEE